MTNHILLIVHGDVEMSRLLLVARRKQLPLAMLPGPLSMEGDQARLDQAFSNLLRNAARHSSRGSRIWPATADEDNQAEGRRSVRRLRPVVS
jgi:signal transduction histidine kinase